MKDYEIRILKNFISMMPKAYRKRNVNWLVVRDILMRGTSTEGMTSCIAKCKELGIDHSGYEINGEQLEIERWK
jgi:coenzyme F420-reducing hydrogenase gamma subunit